MTYGSLSCDIPVLLPDEAFVRRLAELAAGSTASPGVVVPTAFGRPATRALAAATAVAAITAGAAAAADQLTHTHESPAPPISTRVTEDPSASSTDDPDARHSDHPAVNQPGDGPGSRTTSGPLGGVLLTDPSGTHGHTDHGPTTGPTPDPGDHSGPGDHHDPDADDTDHSDPTGDPLEGGDDGHSGSDSGSGDGSDGPSASGSGGPDGGSGSDPGSGD